MFKKFLRKKMGRLRKLAFSPAYLRWKDRAGYSLHQKERSFYRSWLTPNGETLNLVFDVGAKGGQKSAGFLGLTRSVIAFEPSDTMFAVLKKRFYEEHVMVIQTALGAEEKTALYYEIPGREGYSSLNVKHLETIVSVRGIADPEKIEPHPIAVETLDKYIRAYGTPDFIKIGVEGCEADVVKGLFHPVRFLSFEVNLPDFRAEGTETINCLNALAAGRYRFNFSADEPVFLFPEFADAEAALSYLTHAEQSVLEVFAQLT